MSSHMNVNESATALERELPPARKMTNPNRVAAVQVGNLLFVSGHGPADQNDLRRPATVGVNMTTEEANLAARACAVNMLSSIREYLGDLRRVRRVVKVVGFVNCAPGFSEQGTVIDGASDVFLELWGDAGVHARSAVGVTGLPRGIAVEVEGIFEIDR